MTPKGTPYEFTRAGRIKSARSLYDLVRWNFAMVNKKHHARDDYKKFLKGKSDESGGRKCACVGCQEMQGGNGVS